MKKKKELLKNLKPKNFRNLERGLTPKMTIRARVELKIEEELPGVLQETAIDPNDLANQERSEEIGLQTNLQLSVDQEARTITIAEEMKGGLIGIKRIVMIEGREVTPGEGGTERIKTSGIPETESQRERNPSLKEMSPSLREMTIEGRTDQIDQRERTLRTR